MFVRKTAVVGAGTMGGQIAQTIAAAGIPVVLKDIDDALVQAGLQEARNVTSGQVAKLVERGKLTSEQGEQRVEEVIGLIAGTTSYADFGDVDLVIEAVPERMDIKQAVFAELDAATPGHAILASNTSSLSITEIGEATLRPDKVVGFHYFFPASLMPLIEIVEGEDTSSETVTAAVTFAQAIRKQPITCVEVPGFVVNRILNSGVSEIWRAQEERSLSIKAIDEGVGAAGVVPIGPYLLVNMLGLDTVLHVAEHLAESYGDERFYVSSAMQKLVGEHKLGVKTGGDGLYDAQGQPNVPGDAQPDIDELVELMSLKTLIEACLVLEEGVASHRDIDFGMMAGAGLDPRRGLMPPFMKADAEGLDTILERMESAAASHGERFAAPTILRRLVAQGRLGQSTGQGFYAYPQPDAEQHAETIKLETASARARNALADPRPASGGEGGAGANGAGGRPGAGAGADGGEGAGAEAGVAIAWLANGQMNSLSPQVVDDLAKVWAKVRDSDARALVIASSNPFLFCAGADIKAFTTFDEAAGRKLLSDMHGLLREIETSGIATVAAVNGLAFGGGCELAMACDVRIAARSALFGQPEIKLGIIPGFGGTQRLPRLVGQAKALEMNLIGDPLLAEEAFELGLANRVVEDHELLDTALAWAFRLAGQAPLAVQQIKQVSGAGDLDAGIAAEQAAFVSVLASEDAREGIAAFLGKRAPKFSGR